jgi:dihydroorotase-like cyclic amidohydrolase
MQMRGQSLREIVDDYHERASTKAHIDYGFHLIVGDPTPRVLSRELPELIEQGCTSIKIYLTYEGLKLDDYEILTILDLARREGVMVMVHAEMTHASEGLPTAGSTPKKPRSGTMWPTIRRARGGLQGNQFRGAHRDADPDRACVFGQRGRGSSAR